MSHPPVRSARSGRAARRLAALAVPAAAMAAAAVGFHAWPGDTGHASAAQATATVAQNGVEVTVVVSHGTVRATFRPQRPGFHLYSTTLPADGVDGVGVPTRLAVDDGLRATGSPTSDRPVQLLNEDGLDAPVPVYPDGPVTLTLPVTRTGSATARVVVDYAACSTGTCLIPVTGLVIPVRLG